MDTAISLRNIGKMYKLYYKQQDKIIEAFGLESLFFWKKNNFQEFWALRNINLDIKKGERVGIIGKNGAGKSTLLKIISGNISPSEGSVYVNGKIQALMELGTGFHPEFTGRENIKSSLIYHGFSPKKIKQLEEEIIDFTELEDFINQPIKYYSAGMYARLAFAVSTVLEPEILIIDEILGAGDASFTTKCSLRMKKLTQETGATVLFVSHSMDSVLEICNRAILINQGMLKYDSDPLTVSKIYNKMIRLEDELVLRAKEARLRKKDCRAINELSNEFVPLLFRFCVDKDHPTSRHIFYKISLSCDDNEIANLMVGAPMDNDTNSLNKIIDGKGMMDWGKSQHKGGDFFRAYQNEEGIYCHAPFQLCIPKHLIAHENIRLKINADIDKSEKVHLDLWIKDNYERVSTLDSSQDFFDISLSPYISRIGGERKNLSENQDVQQLEKENNFSEVVENTDLEENNRKTEYSYEVFKENNSIYGTQEVIVKSVDILDKNNTSKRLFFIGEDLRFKIDLYAKEKIRFFVLVISILSTEGKPIGQVYCKSSDLGINEIVGSETIYAAYQPLRIGSGEYMVSIGVFKHYDLNVERENESYCVVDRAVFFKVTQPESIKKGLGAFAHSCTWQYKDIYLTYDPTDHYKSS
ncbi:ABC transporter ATP-binding protein [Desulforamulus ferrireducens]|uniref:ABC transporter domain-containing protein n=1 Tax=Desulforamulus ferrireducens TaxID=1833852 RepID=A0A1S6J014_9FIRM|nr:ABC transporter ATP-binding protein [Desulforamulus ferrireducens]AQS60359.1 hypothetical protein B0537_15570 [Desulforamulus ferrireducens]